jgi:hypothetical protein
MKKQLFSLILSLITLSSYAQYTPLFKYEVAPTAFEHIFLDHIKDFRAATISTSTGQYVGQTNELHSLYGYGQYITDDGNVIIGKFRQGELIQGISLGKDNVIVGNKKFYCSYSLTTGQLEYIYNNGTKQISQPDEIKDYTFMSQDFANGDKFIGELYKGKRHGLGIYYYADGGLWYGCFINDIRNGFGAWFKADKDLVIGLWDGEEERRCIFIPQK